MSYTTYPSRKAEPAIVEYDSRWLGANGAALTKVEGGLGVTCTRSGEGAYTFTFNHNPGSFVRAGMTFQATTPADLKGYTCVFGEWTVSNGTYTIACVVYDSSFAAADLIAAQWAQVLFVFKRAGSI